MKSKPTRRIQQIREHCRPFLKPFARLSFLALCTQALYLLFPLITGKILNAVIEGGRLLLVYCLVAMLLIQVASKLAEWFLARCHIKEIITDLEAHISKLTITRILRFSVGQITNQNSGFKQDTLKKGESAMSELLYTFFMEFVPALIRVAITVTALFFISYLVGLVALVSIFFFTLVSIRVNQQMVPRIKKVRKIEAELSTRYWEVIRHLRLVIVSSQEERAITECDREYKSYSVDFKDLWCSYVEKVTFIREPLSILGQMAVFAIATHLALEKTISYGELVILVGWTFNAFGAMHSIGSMQRRLVRNFVMVGKYFDLLDIPPAIEVIPNPIQVDSFKGKIEFKGVHFKYPSFKFDLDEEKKLNTDEESDSPALSDVSFTIEPGKVCAFVGHSGSGKSTAVNLILRGYDPDKGQVLIDGNDLRLIDPKQWRGVIGTVEQDPKLWDNTLRYNIAYGLSNNSTPITDSDLHVLAKKTRIDEFFKRLGPKGFDMVIGENGIQLSGGQRQRVAIARALVRDPRLLILDEATNALDPKNEQFVHEAIREAMKGRTGIIIAHRLSAVRHADQILVFDKGKVVGNGRHSDLMQSCEVYNELVSREILALS